MRADSKYLLDLLSARNLTFFIPPYQRNYEWSLDNCRVFLSDVQKVARDNVRGVVSEHFFGSIIYVVEKGSATVPHKYVLIDGQQRITTVMLLVLALRDTSSDPSHQEAMQRLYVQNEIVNVDTEYKMKLKQVESDGEVYTRLVLNQHVEPRLRGTALFRNYSFLKKAVKGLSEEERKGLLDKGLQCLAVVTVELEPDRNHWESPQEIFESMNSLGKPLSLADLVRNYLLMGKDTETQNRLYHGYWLRLERALPGLLSELIRDWMQADQHRSYKEASEKNFKSLYSEFKEIAKDRSAESILEDLVEFADAYSVAIGEASAGIGSVDQVIADLKIIGVSSANSYISELVLEWQRDLLTEEKLITALSSLRTYFLRRRVLGLTRVGNKHFAMLGSRIREIRSSDDVARTVFRQLSNQEYALRLPNNVELENGLRTTNFFSLGRSANYPKLLLSLAEEHLTGARPSWEHPPLKLDLIMPEQISDTWKQELGENWEDVHLRLLNNIGDVVLGYGDRPLGSRSFESVKGVLRESPAFQVNLKLVTTQEVWNEAAILSRADYLTSLMVHSVLALPPSFQDSNNWKQQGAHSDSRLILNKLIGETIQFVDDPLVEALVVSDTEVLFEGKKMNLSPLTKLVKERAGTANKSGAYRGINYWTWGDDKLVDLHSRIPA